MHTCGRRVLIVDDDIAFRVLIRRLLSREGFQVFEAGSGEEAIALVVSGQIPDVILLDYRMPGLSGCQTLGELRRHRLQIPAVLFSAEADVNELAEKCGFDSAVEKACSNTEVLGTIKQLLSQSTVKV